ncbi:hypothetical protein AJ88_24255 [Mesorhizobium amorphae CCBAU 01583]|nr:hypothetical protein AJ88_24255 [Mesorhizobium amorphae CCBAU 01583]
MFGHSRFDRHLEFGSSDVLVSSDAADFRVADAIDDRGAFQHALSPFGIFNHCDLRLATHSSERWPANPGPYRAAINLVMDHQFPAPNMLQDGDCLPVPIKIEADAGHSAFSAFVPFVLRRCGREATRGLLKQIPFFSDIG